MGHHTHKVHRFLVAFVCCRHLVFRHQILLKATALGLKESTTRGVKRRREGEVPNTSEAAPSIVPPMSSLTGTAVAVPSPAQSHTTTSTPSGQPSPAIHNPVPPP